MGVRILYDENENQAALYDSVTDWAFGPLFSWEDGVHPLERAESFVKFCEETEAGDARALDAVNKLEEAYNLWRAQIEARKTKEECTCPCGIRENGAHSIGCPRWEGYA